jgi:hypothetical protein
VGVDIAVCFTRDTVQLSSLLASPALEQAGASQIYLVAGQPETRSGGLSFFCLWADAFIDLDQLCIDLSRAVTPICIAWKAEHGGVGGYIRYDHGTVGDDIDSQDDSYLDLPSLGVETTFNLTLPLSDDDRLFFPELLFGSEVSVYRLTLAPERQADLSPASALNQLFEGDLDVEPILPIDTF